MEAERYRLAPGTDILPLSGGDTLLRSDAVAVRLEGPSSALFRDRVLPLLDGSKTLDEIGALLPDIGLDDLRHHLEALVRADVLRRDGPGAATEFSSDVIGPFLSFLESLGVPAPEARSRLGRLRIAIAGLEAHGAHAADALAASGVGTIVLADPYACQPGNVALMASAGSDAIGQPRQEVVKAALERQGSGTTIELLPENDVTRTGVERLAGDCHLLVSCVDKGFSSVSHWINAAGLAHGVPAIYAQLRGPKAVTGPVVVPGQTACFMCWRMRSIACEDDFVAAMAYEEFLDGQRRPALHDRSVFPALAPYLGAMVAVEALKLMLLRSAESLVGKVSVFDLLQCRTEVHAVLQTPDCPACRKKGQGRVHPPLGELTGANERQGDILEAAPQLVSPLTGVVRSLQPVPKDPSEPAAPYLFRADLANHRFLSKPHAEALIASGKDMTLEAARIKTLGEAVERYSAACWEPQDILYERRADLPGDALHPEELVLYAPWQYAHISYAPYTEESTLGWAKARSLITGNEVFVPAQAVFMGYEPLPPEERIIPDSSNGLAGGRTQAEAVLAAIGEVLERDAFLITWMNRLPTNRVDAWSHPDRDLVQLLALYRRRGVEFQLHRLPTDHPIIVFMAVAVQVRGDGPAAVAGLGADTDPASAARKALLEACQVRPGLRASLRSPEKQKRVDELVADPLLASTLDDHDMLYADPRAIGAFDFLFVRPVEAFEWETSIPPSPPAALETIVDHFRSTGGELLWSNVTAPDMAALGLYAARAIVPGFQPIHFGSKEARLGGTRLYDLPDQLGLSPATGRGRGLNEDPHPLA